MEQSEAARFLHPRAFCIVAAASSATVGRLGATALPTLYALVASESNQSFPEYQPPTHTYAALLTVCQQVPFTPDTSLCERLAISLQTDHSPCTTVAHFVHAIMLATLRSPHSLMRVIDLADVQVDPPFRHAVYELDGLIAVYLRKAIVAFHSLTFESQARLATDVHHYMAAATPTPTARAVQYTPRVHYPSSSTVANAALQLGTGPTTLPLHTALFPHNAYHQTPTPTTYAAHDQAPHPLPHPPPDPTAAVTATTAQYVIHLESLRRRDVSTALDTLHRYFDRVLFFLPRQAAASAPDAAPPDTTSHQYAALGLAIANAQLGNHETASRALDDTITAALACDDPACHATAREWFASVRPTAARRAGTQARPAAWWRSAGGILHAAHDFRQAGDTATAHSMAALALTAAQREPRVTTHAVHAASAVAAHLCERGELAAARNALAPLLVRIPEIGVPAATERPECELAAHAAAWLEFTTACRCGTPERACAFGRVLVARAHVAHAGGHAEVAPADDAELDGLEAVARLHAVTRQLHDCVRSSHALCRRAARYGRPARVVDGLQLAARAFLMAGVPDSGLRTVLASVSLAQGFGLDAAFVRGSVVLAECMLQGFGVLGADAGAVALRTVCGVHVRAMEGVPVADRADVLRVRAECVIRLARRKQLAPSGEVVDLLRRAAGDYVAVGVLPGAARCFYLLARVFEWRGQRQSRNDASMAFLKHAAAGDLLGGRRAPLHYYY